MAKNSLARSDTSSIKIARRSSPTAARLLMLGTALGLLAACSSTDASDPSATSMGRGKTKLPPGKTTDPTSSGGGTTPTPAPAPSTGGVYDVSLGLGVDSGGFADLPLRSGAHRYFVSASGSDGYGCSGAQNPATPLKTVAAGAGCIANGAGDQLLVAEGSSFNEALPWIGDANHPRNGYSAQYPTVIQSYDPTDPMNDTKYGRGDQRGARPVLTAPQGQIGNGSYGFIAIRGLDLNPGNVPNVNLMIVGKAHDILLENNLFRYTGLSYDSAESTTTPPTMQHLVVRNNSFFGQWNSVNGRAGGVYAAGNASVTLEDNIFWHCGWKVGASRDDDYSVGGATVFSHSYYLQTNSGGIVRRNLSADGAGDGGIARGDIVMTENLFIDNPNSMGLGGGPSYNSDRPSGVSIQASDNAVIGDADVNTTHPLGWGITVSNGIAGSAVYHNLLVRTRNPSGPSVMALANIAPFNQPSYMAFHHNVIYLWAASGHTYQSSGFGYDAQVHTSYDYNSWDDPAGGTNSNSSSAPFANAYTPASLYAALGYADKSAFINYVITHPEAHLQRTGRTLLFTGYGL